VGLILRLNGGATYQTDEIPLISNSETMRDETQIISVRVGNTDIGQGYPWDGKIVFDKRIVIKKQQELLERLFEKLKARYNTKPLLEFGPSTLEWDLADLHSAAIVVIKYRAEAHLRVLFYNGEFVQFGTWEPEENVCSGYPQCEFVFETIIK